MPIVGCHFPSFSGSLDGVHNCGTFNLMEEVAAEEFPFTEEDFGQGVCHGVQWDS